MEVYGKLVLDLVDVVECCCWSRRRLGGDEVDQLLCFTDAVVEKGSVFAGP